MSEEQGRMDSSARTVARQHTAQLLKMLRGYAPPTETATVPPAESSISPVVAAVTVADVPGVYVRRQEQADHQPLPLPPSLMSVSPRTAFAWTGRRLDVPVPTVGESLLRQEGKLGRLVAQARRLAKSNRVFQAYLLPHLRDHAILLQMDEKAWTVQTESPGWATRLRYALHDIRLVLGQQLGFPLPKPRIRVVPVARPVQTRRPRMTLSRETAQELERAACRVTDRRLSAALRRLAQHASHGPEADG